MANILILGGGLSGVTAAESVAEKLSAEHQITLVSRNPRFIRRDKLVDLAFGKHEAADLFYDLRRRMFRRGVGFIQGEVARVDPYDRRVTIAHGDVHGSMYYDYLIFALGGRLATERIPGFFEHAHHPLTIDGALKFGAAIRNFNGGRAVIGYSSEAKSVAPVYETAIALSTLLERRVGRERAQVTIVAPGPLGAGLTGSDDERIVRDTLDEHRIEVLSDFPVHRVSASSLTSAGNDFDHDLLMLLPPFVGPSPVREMGITDARGFIRVDGNLRVDGVERMYAVGDGVGVAGPKMGHVAKLQAEIAASNLVAEIEGRQLNVNYEHHMESVFDEEIPVRSFKLINAAAS